jgi:quercetin dioxygenase-like cupin family protein
MTARSTALQSFLEALMAAFTSASKLEPAEFAIVEKLFVALDQPQGAGRATPGRLPVCDHLPNALGRAKLTTSEVANLAEALERIAPLLVWKRRASGGLHASDNWHDGHANAVIVGTGGLEQRADVDIGVSLLAPNVRYPDHRHPPEEIYMILSHGCFQHGDDAWCEPGPGGIFHNPPAIKHAMASGDTPLLAIWTMIV